MMTLFYVAMGTAFGFVLSRSGAADYDFIQRMFLLHSFQLYGVLGTAVLIAAPGLWAIQKRGRTVPGDPISIQRKDLNKGTVVGAVLFGVGWSITGMCPGPMFVNMGEGKVYAVAAMAGALAGAALFGTMYDWLRQPLGLPALDRPKADAGRPSVRSHPEVAVAR